MEGVDKSSNSIPNKQIHLADDVDKGNYNNNI